MLSTPIDVNLTIACPVVEHVQLLGRSEQCLVSFLFFYNLTKPKLTVKKEKCLQRASCQNGYFAHLLSRISYQRFMISNDVFLLLLLMSIFFVTL